MRNDDKSYWTAKRLGLICESSATRVEALRRIKDAFPHENLTELVQHIAPFRALKE